MDVHLIPAFARITRMELTDALARDMRAVQRALRLLKARRARLEATIAAARLSQFDPRDRRLDGLDAEQPTLERWPDAVVAQPLPASVEGFRREHALGVLIPQAPRYFGKG
jgi:hypothetical protein